MNHTMANAVYFSFIFNDTRFGRQQKVYDMFDRLIVIQNLVHFLDFTAVMWFVGKQCAGCADFFYGAFADELFCTHLDELKFYRGAAAIQDKYLHDIFLLLIPKDYWTL